MRTNRSTQHWTVQITQAGPNGAPNMTTTATVVTAARRDTWGESDLPMPEAPRPETVERMSIGPLRRGVAPPVRDAPVQRRRFPRSGTSSLHHSETRIWLRDGAAAAARLRLARRDERHVLSARLAAPREARAARARCRSPPTSTPAPAQLAEVGTGYLLGARRGQQFFNGYFDQAAQLWSE